MIDAINAWHNAANTRGERGCWVLNRRAKADVMATAIEARNWTAATNAAQAYREARDRRVKALQHVDAAT